MVEYLAFHFGSSPPPHRYCPQRDFIKGASIAGISSCNRRCKGEWLFFFTVLHTIKNIKLPVFLERGYKGDCRSIIGVINEDAMTSDNSSYDSYGVLATGAGVAKIRLLP